MASRETVVVTGASGGIGRAVVRRFAREGSSVGLIGRNDTALECARREVEEGGGRALAVGTDVSDAAAMDSAAAAIEDGLGPVDVWVNNAMTTV